ncbi:MAG: hypothetical protein JSV20_01750 [Candidatus Bathyarchaeota archaeon]|nr:MAG: hypothetical protein JSV20_01750 [Candidatus Bathyarchaeota archaeon]
MTCYFRHLRDIFNKAEIEVTKENKREIDKIIHNIVGVEYKNCSNTWKKVKSKLLEDQESFIALLNEASNKL